MMSNNITDDNSEYKENSDEVNARTATLHLNDNSKFQAMVNLFQSLENNTK